jgi:hypothetical protein
MWDKVVTGRRCEIDSYTREAEMSYDLRNEERFSTELLIEEVRLDGRGRYHVAMNLSREGAMLISGDELEEGKRYLWLRFDLPGSDDFVPVLAEVVYERRLGQLFYRGVRYKHIFSRHKDALFAYLDGLSGMSGGSLEVLHG